MKQEKYTPEQVQEFLDEQAIFSLAVLMVDLHVSSCTKNKQGLVNAMLKAGVVIRNNPGFIPRFKAAQKEIIDQIQKARPSDLVSATPTHQVMTGPTPDLTSEMIEEIAHEAPPVDQL